MLEEHRRAIGIETDEIRHSIRLCPVHEKEVILQGGHDEDPLIAKRLHHEVARQHALHIFFGLLVQRQQLIGWALRLRHAIECIRIHGQVYIPQGLRPGLGGQLVKRLLVRRNEEIAAVNLDIRLIHGQLRELLGQPGGVRLPYGCVRQCRNRQHQSQRKQTYSL